MESKALVLAILLGVSSSCAQLESGHYIRTRSRETWKSLAKKYGMASWKIRASNPGKRRPQNTWVFIPLRRGILGSRARPFSLKAVLGAKDFKMFIWPVPSSRKITSHFGRRWGRPHEGIDIQAKMGAPIIAAANGIVVYSGKELGGYGKLTVLSHRNGLFTVYAHASRNFTKKGQRVHKGQVIALVGKSGRTTGTHLHFEIRYDSKAINPKKLIGLYKR